MADHARVWLWDRTLEVDLAKRTVSARPARLAGLLLGPAVASYPLGLAAIQASGRWSLTPAGWGMTALFSAMALALIAGMLSPWNRSFVVDLAARVVRRGGPWGRGPGDEWPLDQVTLTISNVDRGGRPRRRLILAPATADEVVLLDLANDAADLPALIVDAVAHDRLDGLASELRRIAPSMGRRFGVLVGGLLLVGPVLLWFYR